MGTLGQMGPAPPSREGHTALTMQLSQQMGAAREQRLGQMACLQSRGAGPMSETQQLSAGRKLEAPPLMRAPSQGESQVWSSRCPTRSGALR